MYRTQITFTDQQGSTLREQSQTSGMSVAELVRRAVERQYVARPTLKEKLEIIERVGGLWEDRGISDSVAEVKKLRRPLGPRPE